MCGCSLTPHSKSGFIRRVRLVSALVALSSLTIAVSSQAARERVEPRIVEKISPLPVALSNDFEFRKTKLFFLSDKPPKPGEGAPEDIEFAWRKIEFPKPENRDNAGRSDYL